MTKENNNKMDDDMDLMEKFKEAFNNKEILSFASIMGKQPKPMKEISQEDFIKNITSIENKYFVYNVERSDLKGTRTICLGMIVGNVFCTWIVSTLRNGVLTMNNEPKEIRQPIQVMVKNIRNTSKFTMSDIFVVSSKETLDHQ